MVGLHSPQRDKKMIEVEVKARAKPDTKEMIEALGAVYAGTEHQHDIYFNSPLKDFRTSDEALRIRIKEEGPRLTYKGPKLDPLTKTRLELTTEIARPLEMEQILLSLGFVRSAEVKKCRVKYALGRMTFALDEVEGLGSFLEIEASASDEEDWTEKSKEVLDVLSGLGLHGTIRKSYLELLEEKHRII